MRIGFVSGNFYPRTGGLEMVTHFQALGLKKVGHDVAVACSSMPEIPKGFKYPYNCYRSSHFSFFTPLLQKLNREKMINNERVDLLHGAMVNGGGWEALPHALKHNIPLVAQSHGADVQCVPEIQYGASLIPEHIKRIHEVFKYARTLIAVSQINLNDMVNLGADEGKISIVHNGIPWEDIQSIKQTLCRADYQLNDEDFVLVIVGRNRPVKRMELLCQAIHLLKDKPHLRCLCVGPEQELSALVKQYDISNLMVLCGRIPKTMELGMTPPYQELINVLRLSDLYVSTSYVEACGLAALEAYSCGLPVLCGKRHGVSEMLMKEPIELKMDKETPEELADMIECAMQKRNCLAELKQSRISDARRWSWDNQIPKLLSVYQKATH